MAGYASATLVNSSSICRNSVVVLLRKWRRAGTLKKRFFTLMEVPRFTAHGSCSFTSVPSITMRVPASVVDWRVFSSTWVTAAIDASASPRKPIVRIVNRSSILRILEVACRSKLIRASVGLIPLPLSITCISSLPASLIISCISVAPASMAFSNSSLTADAGRWITSPAAIWLAI